MSRTSLQDTAIPLPNRSSVIYQQAALAIARSRRRGLHSYRNAWEAASAADLGGVGTDVLQWAREVIASCRRPFGIDYFDLALTVSEPARGLTSLTLKKARPILLYGEGIDDELAQALERARKKGDGVSPLRISAVLFSWGDAADAALPSR
jgi:hypothetical protein